MPDRAIVPRRVRGGASRAKGTGEEALDRLTRSVEAAQDALKDLRKELSRGTREILKDLDTTLKDARRNLRSVSSTVSNDLQQVQRALTTAKPASTRATRSRPSTTAASARRKRTTTAGEAQAVPPSRHWCRSFLIRGAAASPDLLA
jgi:sugar-specific transcriptional regulator TrmB